MSGYYNKGSRFKDNRQDFRSRSPFSRQGGRQFHQQEEIQSPINDEEAKKILNLNKDNAKDFDELANKCAKEISRISYSKLRDFYAYIKDIKEFDKVKLYLLKPKLAYAVGKESDKSKKVGLEKFQKMMSLLINNCDNEDKFEHLNEFFEAVIAYCRVYNPKGD